MAATVMHGQVASQSEWSSSDGKYFFRKLSFVTISFVTCRPGRFHVYMYVYKNMYVYIPIYMYHAYVYHFYNRRYVCYFSIHVLHVVF
jgi:hypothetical protein